MLADIDSLRWAHIITVVRERCGISVRMQEIEKLLDWLNNTIPCLLRVQILRRRDLIYDASREASDGELKPLTRATTWQLPSANVINQSPFSTGYVYQEGPILYCMLARGLHRERISRSRIQMPLLYHLLLARGSIVRLKLEGKEIKERGTSPSRPQ
jgi:hypothetical protein